MSDNQVIPEAAVEAAVEAFVGAKGTLNDHILAILEAAAPHMHRDAWDAGFTAARAMQDYEPAP